MGDRVENMAYHGIWQCPEWCAQPADEHEYQCHLGDWQSLSFADGTTVQVRPMSSWYDDTDPGDSAEVIFSSDSMVLNSTDAYNLAGLVTSSEGFAENWGQMKWAYDGAAEHEQAAAEADDDVE